MIKKVQIFEKESEEQVSEYIIVTDREVTDEDYCDLAWKFLLDEFAIDTNRRLHYRFAVSDYVTH